MATEKAGEKNEGAFGKDHKASRSALEALSAVGGHDLKVIMAFLGSQSAFSRNVA